LYQANLKLLWPYTAQVRQWPIGRAEYIRTFTRFEMLDFYRAWYRPERMVVVLVGDLDPGKAVRLVAAELGKMKALGPARADVVQLVPEEAGPPTVRVFMDPGVSGASCELEHPFSDPVSPDSHERRVQRLRRQLAFSMLNRRATKLAKAADGKFVVAGAGVASPLPGWSYAHFGGSGTIGNWQVFMTNLDRAYRQAYEFGFTSTEMDVARRGLATAYRDAVETASSWHSDWLATSIANSVANGTVFTTPALAQRDVAADLATTTAAECWTEFRRIWSSHSLHVFVSTNPNFSVSPGEIAGTLNESRAAAVTPPVEKPPPVFAYSSFGAPGRVVSRRKVVDLDFTQAQFANGVRLNFKPTNFEVGSVEICLRVGLGRLSQPRDQPGLDLLASGFLTAGGLGRHSIEELQDIMASHAFSFSFSVDSDALTIAARSAPEDLGLCLHVLTAYLTDAGYRADALPSIGVHLTDLYSSLAASPSGPIAMQATRILSGGDRRFGIASSAEVNRLTVDQVRRWIDPQLKSGPVEISVVGDTSWEAAAAAVAETLGALAPRQERPSAASADRLHPPAKPDKPLYVYTTSPALRQVALGRYCVVPDLRDIHMLRRCNFLAALLADRLRLRLRDELGAAYDVEAQFVALDGFPEFSFFGCSTTVGPEHAQKANVLMAAAIEAIRRGRFSNDEFERTRLPILARRERDLHDNTFWCYTVLADSQQRPEQVAATRDRQQDYAAITRADLEALAATYFASDRWFQFVAFPAAQSFVPGAQPFVPAVQPPPMGVQPFK
jgi:zinc protease